MRKYLVVVHVDGFGVIYYESLSRSALNHLKRENYLLFGDREAFKVFGAKSVDVIDLNRKVAVSGAYVKDDGENYKCNRKTAKELAEINDNMEEYLRDVYAKGVNGECAQSGTADGEYEPRAV